VGDAGQRYRAGSVPVADLALDGSQFHVSLLQPLVAHQPTVAPRLARLILRGELTGIARRRMS